MKLRTLLWLMLALFILTAAVYSRAVIFPFCIIDDGDYVTANTHVTSGLTIDNIIWAFTAFHAGNWHPLTWLSLMLDSQLFGVTPMGFHVVNITLHALNTSLLFLLLNAMTGAVRRSAFVAACFSLHPLHVESVVWIAERKDVLSMLFLMVTLLFYSGYVKQHKRRLYVFSLMAFAAGLMAKPMLVTVPVILLFLDFWPLNRMNGNQDSSDGPQLKYLLVEKIPFALLSATSSALTLLAQKPGISTLTNVPLFDRITNALQALVMYVVKMVVPIDLAIIYPLVQVPLWKAAGAAAIISAVTVMVIRFGSTYRYLATGWFWYLVTLLPVIGIIQVGKQSMADRYTYIPFIGLFIMASWGGAELSKRMQLFKNAINSVAVGTVLLLAIVTWNQLGYWRDNLTLFNHALEATENNYFAHYSLGLVYEQMKMPERAIAEYQKSIEIEPRDPMVHFDLGFCLDSQGRSVEAVRYFEEAIKLKPGFAQAHFTLGIVLGKLGAVNESIGKFSDALRLEPDNPKFLNNMGIALAQQGLIDDAITLFTRVLQLNPNDEKAVENLQIARQQKSQAGSR